MLNLIQKNRTAEILREIATDKILIGWSIAAFVFDLMLERINCYSPKMKFLGLDKIIRLSSDRFFIDNSKMNQKFSRYENNTVCIIDLVL